MTEWSLACVLGPVGDGGAQCQSPKENLSLVQAPQLPVVSYTPARVLVWQDVWQVPDPLEQLVRLLHPGVYAVSIGVGSLSRRWPLRARLIGRSVYQGSLHRSQAVRCCLLIPDESWCEFTTVIHIACVKALS